MLTSDDAKEMARQTFRRAGKRIKERQEATAFAEHYGKSHMFVNNIMNSADPALSNLFRMASWLDVEVEELLREPETGGNDAWLSEPPVSPPLVERAQELFDQGASPFGRVIAMDPHLEAIDEYRYSNPATARQQLHEVLETLPREQIPYALNVAASCSRMMLDLRDGACHARYGGDLAAALGNPLAIGDNLQRWVYLHGNANNRLTALKYNKRSTEVLIEGGSKRKLAETIIDRGHCLYYLDEFERSERVYRSARAFSDCLSTRHSIAAMQGVAMSRLARGDREGAREDAVAAERAAGRADNELLHGNCLWLLGHIEALSGHLDAAERYYLVVAERLQRDHPLDALLALLEIYSFNERIVASPRTDHHARVAAFVDVFADFPKIRAALQHLLALLRLKRLTKVELQRLLADLHACRPQYYAARAA